MKRAPDIVVISDAHLGTYGCHAKELLCYLKSIRPKTLVINGDFINLSQFRKRHFPSEHLQVIQYVLKMAAKGTKVYYVTGNHDDILRRYADFSTGNIHLRDKLILRLKDKQVWIFHGDIFDLSVRYSSLIVKMGNKGYNCLININRFINKVRHLFGFQSMSLARKIKNRVKKAVSFISDFEETAIDLARQQGYDFVICGHIHRPKIRKAHFQNQSVTYLNAGDWVENLTALEYQCGQWSIHQYDTSDYRPLNNRLIVKGFNDPIEKEEEKVPLEMATSRDNLLRYLLTAKLE